MKRNEREFIPYIEQKNKNVGIGLLSDPHININYTERFTDQSAIQQTGINTYSFKFSTSHFPGRHGRTPAERDRL